MNSSASHQVLAVAMDSAKSKFLEVQKCCTNNSPDPPFSLGVLKRSLVRSEPGHKVIVRKSGAVRKSMSMT